MKINTLFILSFILILGTVSLAQSLLNNGIDFDGNGDYANTLNDPFFPTRNGTLEAWVKVRNINAQIGNVFFEKNEEQWNHGDFYLFFETASGKIKARIQSSPEKPPIQIDVKSNMNFWNSFDEWHHIAFTWGSNGMKLFVDGELQVDQNSITHPAMSNTYNFYVGADGYMLHNGNYVVSNFFDGIIDEARVWDHQRTAEQIISIWDVPLDSSYFLSLDSGLVGYWRFDELEDLGVNSDGVDDVRDFSVLNSHLDLEGDAHLVPSNIVIPVELVSFTSTVDGNMVNLSWITSTEINNMGFRIIRDGEEIGFIPGYGTTAEPHQYSYTDENVENGTHIYSLMQFDYDGTCETFGEIELTVNNIPKDYSLQQNYPNPFNPSTIISFTLPERTKVVLKVYNVLGSEVAELINDIKSPGRYEVKFNSKGLSSGIYFYTIQAGMFTGSKKMILLK